MNRKLLIYSVASTTQSQNSVVSPKQFSTAQDAVRPNPNYNVSCVSVYRVHCRFHKLPSHCNCDILGLLLEVFSCQLDCYCQSLANHVVVGKHSGFKSKPQAHLPHVIGSMFRTFQTSKCYHHQAHGQI